MGSMSSSAQTFHTSSEDETIALGRRVAKELPQQTVVLLIGNLGAGKTTLAKGIISGLGSLAEPSEVSSPTFTLIHEYGPNAAGTRAYHIDLYRLDEPSELLTLGLDEIFEQKAVVLIEWGERFPQVMPLPRVEIRLTRDDKDESGEQRVIEMRMVTS